MNLEWARYWIGLFGDKTDELPGVAIPAGSLVLSLLGSANRDESHYTHPDEFDIDRKPEGIMSFGAGPHFCLGSHLARMEARIGLEVLFDRFAELNPVGDEVSWMDSYFARGLATLPVRFRAR